MKVSEETNCSPQVIIIRAQTVAFLQFAVTVYVAVPTVIYPTSREASITRHLPVRVINSVPTSLAHIPHANLVTASAMLPMAGFWDRAIRPMRRIPPFSVTFVNLIVSVA